MSITSKLFDERIQAWNYLIEIPIGDYLAIAKGITDRNEYQRRRVKSSHSVYSLLRDDILKGCVIPPIVLAYTGAETPPDESIGTFLANKKNELVILDGLQRTHTLLDLDKELADKNDEQALAKLRAQKIRIEFYAKINRLGVLYRMLTLNTGQTPMTLRQQVEMLYLDYSRAAIEGVRLIRESEETAAINPGEYSFKDIVEGFNSYLERNELPIDRFDLLESIKSLEKLAQENQNKDLFASFLKTYHAFVLKVVSLAGSADYSAESLGISGLPFGKNALHIFTKPQAISGFGAALGKLKDFELVNSFEDIQTSVASLVPGSEPEIALGDLLKKLEQIRLTSKKIGNAQRMYFQYFFRELLNPNGDSYRNFATAASNAFQKYQSQIS